MYGEVGVINMNNQMNNQNNMMNNQMNQNINQGINGQSKTCEGYAKSCTK